MNEFMFYTEKELVKEIKKRLNVYGDTVKFYINLEKKILNVNVDDPDIEDEVTSIIDSLFEEFYKGRQRVLRDNPFVGVNDVLESLDEEI